MARPPRIHAPGIAQHLWLRGNNRSNCFLTDKDRHVYLLALAEEAQAWHCDIHCYVLMTNHVHLLATGRREMAVSRLMHVLNRRYSHYFNREHQRTGTLYEGRFCSSVVQTDRHLFTVMRYIELNPVRAGMVARPGDYRWSSFRENALGAPPRVVTPHPAYEALGPSPADRGNAYLRMFESPLDAASLASIREGILRGRPTTPSS